LDEIAPLVEQLAEMLTPVADYEQESSSDEFANTMEFDSKLKKRERRKKKKLLKKAKSFSEDELDVKQNQDEVTDDAAPKLSKSKSKAKTASRVASFIQKNQILGSTLLLSASAVAFISAVGLK